METVFSRLVSVSLMANWLILAVILLRLLLKKAPKKVICMLWAIVAVRLLLPVSIESPVSMIPQSTSLLQEAVDTTLIHPERISANGIQTNGGQASGSEPAMAPQRRVPAAVLVWCAGTVGMLGYFCLSCFKMRRLVAEAIPETENIWICDAVTTPFIQGLFHPRIYLPSGLSGANRDYVLAHEQSHLRRKDYIWKPLAFVLLTVYWFDPLVWAACGLVCRDIEFACDESTVRNYGMAERKAYSAALLACSTGKRLVLACPVAFGETAVVQRVRNVLRCQKPRFWVLLICAVVIPATAVGFLTVPVKKTVPEVREMPILEEPSTDPVPTRTEPPEQAEETRPDPWADFPEGIRIDTYIGETFTAHIMLVRDPSKVYLATSAEQFSKDVPGLPMDAALEQEQALAAVNAGYFFDDGSSSDAVGSIPAGLTLSQNAVVWDALHELPPERGFVGFNRDDILIVSDSMTAEEAQENAIRDGCSAGPVLMVNGNPVMAVYDGHSGYNSRSAIGQRADGTVLLLCAEGRTPNSLGATYADLIDILLEYEVVNACALMGGSASNMLYRDTAGRYGDAGKVIQFNPLPSGPTTLRKMPTFWMVNS